MPIDHTMLTDVFEDVLEKFAFMFADATEIDDLPDPEDDIMQVGMSFSGTFRGELVLALPTGMGAEIAANVLGVDAQDPKACAGAPDAAKELLNVVCGRVLTEIAGETPVFDLSVPQVSQLALEAWTELKEQPDAVAFLVDDYPVLLRANIDND